MFKQTISNGALALMLVLIALPVGAASEPSSEKKTETEATKSATSQSDQPQAPKPKKPNTWKGAIAAGDKAFIQKKYEEAEKLYLEAEKKAKDGVGTSDEEYLLIGNKLVQVFYAENKYKEAEPHMKNLLNELERKYGPKDPSVKAMRANYDKLVEIVKKKDEEAAAVIPQVTEGLQLTFDMLDPNTKVIHGIVKNKTKKTAKKVSITAKLYKELESVDTKNATISSIAPEQIGEFSIDLPSKADSYEITAVQCQWETQP